MKRPTIGEPAVEDYIDVYQRNATGGLDTISSALRYYVHDPGAVSLELDVRPNAVGTFWTFARNLGVLGLSEPVGEGNVHFDPTIKSSRLAPRIGLTLKGDRGEQKLLLPRRPFRWFIIKTTDYVPLPNDDTIQYDIDALIKRIFQEGDPT